MFFLCDPYSAFSFFSMNFGNYSYKKNTNWHKCYIINIVSYFFYVIHVQFSILKSSKLGQLFLQEEQNCHLKYDVCEVINIFSKPFFTLNHVQFLYPLVLQPQEIILTRRTKIGTYVLLNNFTKCYIYFLRKLCNTFTFMRYHFRLFMLHFLPKSRRSHTHMTDDKALCEG